MTVSQKFLFDTSFEPQDIAERATAISLETHAQALQEEYAKGLNQGRETAQEGIDARNTEQLQTLNFKLVDLLSEQLKYREKVQTLLASILQKSLEKLFPVLAEKEGIEEIVSIVSTVFQETSPGREMVVWAHPDTVNSLQEKLQSLSTEGDTSEQLTPSKKKESVNFTVQGDPSLTFSDCRLTWEGGGLERLSSRLYQEIQTCLERLSMTDNLHMPRAENSEEGTDQGPAETPLQDLPTKDAQLQDRLAGDAPCVTESPLAEEAALEANEEHLQKIESQHIKETQDE